MMLQICNINQDVVRRMVRVEAESAPFQDRIGTSLSYRRPRWSQSSGGRDGGRCKLSRAKTRYRVGVSGMNESCELSIIFHFLSIIPKYWTTHVQRTFTLPARALLNCQSPTQTHVHIANPSLWPARLSLLLPSSLGRMQDPTGTWLW